MPEKLGVILIRIQVDVLSFLNSFGLNKEHVCSTCGKQFSRKNSLKLHEKRHTGEKAQECYFCDKRFIAKKERIIHEASHTKDRQFKCTDCEKLFVTQSQLNSHIFVHSNTNCCCI